LYPNEKWEPLENGIFVAKSRMPRSAEQMNILEKSYNRTGYWRNVEVRSIYSLILVYSSNEKTLSLPTKFSM
jgi:hypothetical protein